jgi:hypothetical protein
MPWLIHANGKFYYAGKGRIPVVSFDKIRLVLVKEGIES